MRQREFAAAGSGGIDLYAQAWLPKHEVCNEPERERVIADLFRWLEL